MKNKTSSSMSRTQKRLMEKQLKEFTKKFNCFSDFQLNLIKDLISDILERRNSDE